MPLWKLYHNSKCSKSREALSFLEAQGLEFQTVEYIKDPLSFEQLTEIVAQLSGPVSSLVRVKEADFVSAPFDVNSVTAVVKGLLEKPHLMERPILQGKGMAVIGRPLENFQELLKR